MPFKKIFGLLTYTIGVACSASLLVPSQAQAVDNELTISSRKLQYEESHYPSFVRLSVLGGASMADTSGGGVGLSGALLADFGRGMFSFESGAEYLTLGNSVSLSDTGGGPNHKVTASSQYVGVPIVVKYNYIEKTNSAFSIKLGAMPAMMLNNRDAIDDQTGTDQSVVLNNNEVFALAGFTGSASLSNNVAFLIDGTYLYGTSDVDYNGTHSQGLVVLAGMRFNL